MEIESITLGSKHKKFYWWLSDNNYLTIRRTFKNDMRSLLVISKENIEGLNEFVKQRGSTKLSNNVEKLALGTEEEGIGTYLMNYCRLSSSEAQIASQIVAIFCEAGIWNSNGRLRCIEVTSCKEECCRNLRNYYEYRLSRKDSH